jgi:hypothetical protein
MQSPETYLGYARAENFGSPGGIEDNVSHVYSVGKLRINEWGFPVIGRFATSMLFLMRKTVASFIDFMPVTCIWFLGLRRIVRPVRFRVSIDGAAPGNNHGMDIDAEGRGIVGEHRLYQLIRKRGTIRDHVFEIQFLNPGVQVYAFTFG